MPIYEYRCNRCDQTFEKIEKFSDQPLTVHEGCGGAVERMITSAALQFKGSGWYVTDYAKKNGGASVSDKSETKDKPEKKSEAKGDSSKDKSESKPAPAKSETSAKKSDSKSDSK